MPIRRKLATLLLAWVVLVPVLVLGPDHIADAAVDEDKTLDSLAAQAPESELVFGERLSSSPSRSSLVLESVYLRANPVPAPEWEIWPGKEQNQIVNLESFLFITDFEPHFWSVCFLWWCQFFRATPWASEFRFRGADRSDNNSTEWCFGPGNPYVPRVTNPPCGKDWPHSSDLTGHVRGQARDIHRVDSWGVAGSFTWPYWPSRWSDAVDLDVGEVLDIGQRVDIPVVHSPTTPSGDGGWCSMWGVNVVCWVGETAADLALDAIYAAAPFLREVGRFFEGCGDSFADAVGGVVDLLNQLKDFVTNPGEFIDGKFQEMKELFEAAMADPAGFARDVLGLDRIDENGLADFIGYHVCNIAIGYFTGSASAALLQKARKFMRNRIPDGPDLPNKFPCGRQSSFAADTLVLMADGTHERIDAIRPGDWVMSHNIDTSVWEPQLVVDQWSHLDRGPPAIVSLAEGGSVTATADHLFWQPHAGSWTQAQHLEPGTDVLTPTSRVKVANVELLNARDWTVWELTVVKNHNFAVRVGDHDVLVHNGKRCSHTYDDGSAVHLNSDGSFDYTAVDGTEYTNVVVDANGDVVLVGGNKPRPIFDHSGGSERSPVLSDRADGDGFDSDAGLHYEGSDPTYTDRVDHVLQHQHGNDLPTKPKHSTFPEGVDPIAAVDEAWLNPDQIAAAPGTPDNPGKNWKVLSETSDGTWVEIIVKPNADGSMSNRIVTAYPV